MNTYISTKWNAVWSAPKVQLILLQGFCNFDQPGYCYFRALCIICLCFLQACKGNCMYTQKRNMHNADSRYCGGVGPICFSFVMLCFTLILWDSFVAMVTIYTNQSESTVLWWMYVSAMNITIYSDYDWSQCRQHSFTPGLFLFKHCPVCLNNIMLDVLNGSAFDKPFSFTNALIIIPLNIISRHLFRWKENGRGYQLNSYLIL